MPRIGTILALAVLAAACGQTDNAAQAEGSPAQPAPAEAAAQPNLAACPEAESVDEELRERKEPIPIPAPFAGLVKADMDHFAVSTLDGGTVCVDAGWMESIEEPKVSPDNRFVSFGWSGYEAFGFIVVDRSGKGQAIETGNAPLASPERDRFASIDLSESGFGGFNAFGVWQAEPAGLKELAQYSEEFPPGDWRIERWAGRACVELSVLPIERQPSHVDDFDKAPRDPWFAAEAKGWKPAPGRCPRA